MRFDTRTEATSHIQNFVLAQGARAIQSRKLTGKNRMVYMCTSPTKCSFSAVVTRSQSKNRQGFFLSSFNAKHNGCTGLPRPTAKQLSSMTSAVACVQSNPSVQGKQLIKQLKTLNGVTMGNRMSYRVRDKIKELVSGNYQESCQRLESTLQLFCELNPGTHMAFEVDSKQHFRRAFLSNPSTAIIHQNSQRVLDTSECQWFLLNCMRAGIQMSKTPVFMDRGKSGIAAGATFGLQLHFCTQHIADDLRKKFKGRFTPELDEELNHIQSSETKELFDSQLQAFGRKNADMESYIRSIDPANWALYPHIETVALYGWNTTNFVESDALAARERHPTGFFMHYMETFMETKFLRSQKATTWLAEGKVITDYAESKFVNIATKTCECSFMRQNAIPCRHFTAVLMNIKQYHTIFEYFDECYLVKNYHVMSDVENGLNIKLPRDSDIKTDCTVLGSVPTTARKRDQNKRLPNDVEEVSSSTTKRRRCSNCGEFGHNVRTCITGDCSDVEN
ncbi:Mutatorlike Transposase [Phytophthora megakarya]|uniref:Mutatorlike Transposase n=1 Tax=Phytophthora megakarya TaxID=4795 RepID=A0A225WS66_9STRA|nr:Mutatorlike Transposase [Phytophthora megakarya]